MVLFPTPIVPLMTISFLSIILYLMTSMAYNIYIYSLRLFTRFSGINTIVYILILSNLDNNFVDKKERLTTKITK
jgi:hypothetical protein